MNMENEYDESLKNETDGIICACGEPVYLGLSVTPVVLGPTVNDEDRALREMHVSDTDGDEPLKTQIGTSKAFACGCCGSAYVARFQLRILRIGPAPRRQPKADDYPMTPLRKMMEETGLWNHFVAAVMQNCQMRPVETEPPKNLAKHLDSWAAKIVRYKLDHVPEEIRAATEETLTGGTVAYWGANGVLAVTVAGRIRAFTGMPPRKMSARVARIGAHGRIGTRKVVGERWHRTKFGWVEGDGLLLQELTQKRSVGDFAK